MHLFTVFSRLLAGSLLAAQCATAGKGGYITLINATPYQWELVEEYQSQMSQWKPSHTVAPGTSVQNYVEFKSFASKGRAEAWYNLVGHPTNGSFALHARHGGNRRLEVDYHRGLQSLNNPVKSTVQLSFEHNGAVAFVLAGDGIDEPFLSSNPPVAWMQATLSTIASKTLREIAMPASHDAGMSEITRWYLGNAHNTLTQSGDVYRQLVNGARFLDIRPVLRHGKWHTNHVTWVESIKHAVGGFGRTIEHIVTDVNRFNAQYPGEIVILDLTHDMDRGRAWSPLAPRQWQELYSKLADIADIWQKPDSYLPQDLSTVPISTFIKPGSRSAVLIRIPEYAPLPEFTLATRGIESDPANKASNTSTLEPDVKADVDASKDNIKTGFVALSDIPHQIPTAEQKQTAEAAADAAINAQAQSQSHSQAKSQCQTSTITSTSTYRGCGLAIIPAARLPHTGSYSSTHSTQVLAADQLAKLRALRPSPRSAPLRSTWTITQPFWHTIDVANVGRSILAEAAWAHRALFRDLWAALSADTYPNLVEVDDVWNSQVAALCMAINHHFVGSGGPRRNGTAVVRAGPSSRVRRRGWRGGEVSG